MFKQAVFQETVEGFANTGTVGWSCISDLFKGNAGAVGKTSDEFVTFRYGKRDDTRRVVHFFVRPEMPADPVFIQGFAEVHHPFVRVFAGFAAINRDLVFFAEIEVILDHIDGSSRPVFVEGIDQFIVERRAEYLEIGVPLRAAEEDEVVFVHFPDGGCHAFVQGFEQGVEMVLVEKMRNGFVEQVVPDDSGFVFIPGGDFFPDGNGEFLAFGTVKKERITEAVVDIVAGLAAGRAVHVQQHVKVRFLAPLDGLVEQFKPTGLTPAAQVILVGEQFVVEGDADGVHADGLQVLDIVPGGVVVEVGFPELFGRLGSDELIDCFLDQARRAGVLEFEHIPFRHQPVAEVRAFHEEGLTVGSDDFFAPDAEKLSFLAGGEKGQKHEKKEQVTGFHGAWIVVDKGRGKLQTFFLDSGIKRRVDMALKLQTSKSGDKLFKKMQRIRPGCIATSLDSAVFVHLEAVGAAGPDLPVVLHLVVRVPD